MSGLRKDDRETYLAELTSAEDDLSFASTGELAAAVQEYTNAFTESAFDDIPRAIRKADGSIMNWLFDNDSRRRKSEEPRSRPRLRSGKTAPDVKDSKFARRGKHSRLTTITKSAVEESYGRPRKALKGQKEGTHDTKKLAKRRKGRGTGKAKQSNLSARLRTQDASAALPTEEGYEPEAPGIVASAVSSEADVGDVSDLEHLVEKAVQGAALNAVLIQFFVDKARQQESDPNDLEKMIDTLNNMAIQYTRFNAEMKAAVEGAKSKPLLQKTLAVYWLEHIVAQQMVMFKVFDQAGHARGSSAGQSLSPDSNSASREAFLASEVSCSETPTQVL